MAGDSVTLTCSVTLPTGVTGTPDFQWEGPALIPMSYDPSTREQMVSSGLTLSDITTSQAGLYTCNATLNETSISASLTVAVHSKITHHYDD